MKNEENIQRIVPSLDTGLTSEQVEERKQLGLTNKTPIVVGKTYFEIIVTDLFSFFNILLFIIAGLMIAAQYWAGLTFTVVLLANIVISLAEDIKARRLMGKLRYQTAPKVEVIRNGQKEVVKNQEILMDDIVCLESGNQICVDGKLLEGTLVVNESALTGESIDVVKKTGDYLYSGSYVISGTGLMHAEKVGVDSYIETLHAKARAFKRPTSEILKTLTILFRIIGIIVSTLAIAIFIIYLARGKFSSYELFKGSMKGISGSMVSMIPAGLYLLTSVALAVAVLKLSKKGARVQDFYSVEMLARVNVLCVDKTGTITSGEMDVQKVLLVGNEGYSNDDISQIMSNLLNATKDNNLTAKSLQKTFNYETTKTFEAVLPFNSKNKYSAVTFAGNETFVLGAIEFLNIPNPTLLNHRAQEYTERGQRVLVLGKVKGSIKDNVVDGVVTPIALIILQDHVRENAVETFKWFKENGVQIKVISGDNAAAVSYVALEAGIENADKYISLAGLSDEEVVKAVSEYSVFGRVTPEQKEIIIQELKKQGKTVAMTGDGVNDVLALKRADCSIAMNEGSEAAKNVSHIVLLNSDFDVLPGVVEEGRRVINNIQRTSSLFLTKTIFSMVTTTMFLIAMLFMKDIEYPFHATHFQLWSLINIGLSAFFLALERNREPVKGKMGTNIVRKAVPGAATILAAVLSAYGLFGLFTSRSLYTGVETFEQATTMSVIIFTILGLVVLLKICLPFTKYRAIIFASASTLEVVLLIVAAIISYKVKDGVERSILNINFPSLTLVNWLAIAIIIVLATSIYLIVSYVVEVFKGEHKNAKN